MRLSTITVNNAIVVSQPVYSPKQIINGKEVAQRCVFMVFVAKRNKKAKSNYLRLVTWGRYADLCATMCQPGSSIDANLTPNSYLTHVTLPSGEKIPTPEVSFTVDNIVLCDVTKKAIKAEIAAGHRPVKWDDPTHPDFVVWGHILKLRMNTKYDSNKTTYGFATVHLEKKPVKYIILDEYKRKKRSAHARLYKHPRYINVKGTTVVIKETKVDPKM